MADRDDIIEFVAEFLELDSYPDYGPMGMQVPGAQEVKKIACGVSASAELFHQTAKAGAQLVLVHHGLLWDNEPRTIDTRMKGRLKALFEADITLAAYHLALDSHPEIGNNALLARLLDLDVDQPFGGEPFGNIGVGASYKEPVAIDDFIVRVRDRLEREPLT